MKKDTFTCIGYIKNSGRWQGLMAQIDQREFPDPDEIHDTLVRFGAKDVDVGKVNPRDRWWSVMATVPNRDKRFRFRVKRWLFDGD